MTEGEFPDTRWTLIQKARCPQEGERALEEWCRGYWGPVYSYICSRGYDAESAQELAQSFFEKLLVRGPDQSLPVNLTGAFRAFLMRSIKNFLTDHWRSSRSLKRGGDHLRMGDEWLQVVDDPGPNPEQAFDQKWVLTVIELAMRRLEKEMESRGHRQFFETTRHLIDGRDLTDQDRAKMVKSLGLKDGAFRVALHRMRRRFRKLIEEEVRQTVSSEDEFREEMHSLFQVWS